MIQSYSFGKITIDGKEYTSDLIIYKNTINDKWWRKEGHNLHLEDLVDVLNENPKILIIGTGAYGLMKVPSELIKYLNEKDIRVIVKKTEVACTEYNKFLQTEDVVALFHLTC